tara:strand:+ start:505 stop:1002 length:498 start_codon:yes stop_codon:yes gene_type:complete
MDDFIGTLISWLAIFAFVWGLFSYFEMFSAKDTLRVYQIYKTENRTSSLSGKVLPEFNTEAIREYKVVNGKISRKVGTAVSTYNNCTIFDVKNWSCTFEDGSATFGVKNGLYSSVSNVTKFPHLASLNEPETVSRLRYIIINCEWAFHEGIFVGLLSCGLFPFTI